MTSSRNSDPYEARLERGEVRADHLILAIERYVDVQAQRLEFDRNLLAEIPSALVKIFHTIYTLTSCDGRPAPFGTIPPPPMREPAAPSSPMETRFVIQKSKKRTSRRK